MPPPAQILVADLAEGFVAVRAALGERPGLVHAETLRAAHQALEVPPRLVLCGCHFDEGRMYDVLRHMKANESLAAVPFVAMRALEDELDDTLYESVRIAVAALGGQDFVDLPRWRRLHGRREADQRLTALVESYLGPA